jgi:hypothetical protein
MDDDTTPELRVARATFHIARDLREAHGVESVYIDEQNAAGYFGITVDGEAFTVTVTGGYPSAE